MSFSAKHNLNVQTCTTKQYYFTYTFVLEIILNLLSELIIDYWKLYLLPIKKQIT